MKKSLKMKVLKKEKRLRIYFNSEDPLERALASFVFKAIKAFVYKDKENNDLWLMELGLTDDIISQIYAKDKNAKTK